LQTTRLVYSLLADLGFRSSIGVWPLGARRETNSGGQTCANPDYRAFLQQLKQRGFEIAFHNAAPHPSTREEVIESLDCFQQYFGQTPRAMANHYNTDAIYWGSSRISGWRRSVYNLATLWRKHGKHFGHVEGHPSFWGDVCRDRIEYCRNFVYADINTLYTCPWMPYSDPCRPYVRYWFSASEGANSESFLNTLRDENLDKLEAEGGACIMYTHFGHGFVQDGKLDPQFRRAMERLARRNAWCVTVSDLLDFLKKIKPVTVLDSKIRRQLEVRWLAAKLFRGTS
jgi:hypothetical protein